MTRALGCDVSRWNGAVNFNTMKSAGASFVICKAGQRNFQDEKFSTYWPDAKAAGLLRGAYWFYDWAAGDIAQAQLFCNILGGDWGELPMVLDYEMAPTNMTQNEAQGHAWNFLQEVERISGKVPMIYTGYYFWISWGSTSSGWLKYPFWLAWYANESIIKVPQPWSHWDFWQYSSNGPGPTYGAQGLSMDMNYFNGTVEELFAWANIDEVTTAHNLSIHGPHYCTVCGAQLADIDPIPAPPEPPAPPTYPAYKVKAGTHPNVRSGDGGSYAKMGYLIDDGAIIYVDSTDAQTGYCHIQPAWGFDNSGVRKYFELGGWVWTAYLVKQ